MYLLSGSDFNNLVKREFTTNLITVESSGSLSKVFNCQSQSLRTAEFDLLRFDGVFQEDTQVNDFQDTTHVSMHFQLAGRSDASISGLQKEQPMQQGQYNVLNCIDPISSFNFPKQQHYAYVCVGLKVSFFNDVLAECGSAYQELLAQSLKMKSYTLFDSASTINCAQMFALKLLQSPPIADNLKESYTRSKVKELILLALNTYSTKSKHTSCSTNGYDTPNLMNNIDIEKLNAVKDHLSTNYLSAFTLEGISRRFLLNEFKLKKGFKELFSLTVFGYIQELRMQHAHTLIRSGGLTIGEIAAIIGYTSDSSFIRAFKAFHGYSPGRLLISRLPRS
jgi:AraC family transcriptional activator of pyochelin receptor